jgi:DNA-binding NarL/FixJ family response regulator
LPSVLIADDHVGMRSTLRLLFEDGCGFTVCGEAENGLEAINKAVKLAPNIIVLDLVMPVMNGLEAAEVLKLMLPETPIFLLTAHGGEKVTSAALAIGVNAIFTKGEDLAGLVKRAREVLEP